MPDRKITLASWISISRIIVFFIFVIVDYYNINKFLSVGLLVYIIFSDWLDGFIARNFKQISELGKILDPIADKIVFSLGALYFYFRYDLSIWIFIILFVRDMLLLIFGYYFKEKFKYIPVSNIWGKLSTTFLSFAIFVFYFGYEQYIYLLFIGLFFLFFSSFIYLRNLISKIDNTVINYVNLLGIMLVLLAILLVIDLFIFEINKYVLLFIVLFFLLIFIIYLLFQLAFFKRDLLELTSNYKNIFFMDALSKISFHNIANMLTSFSLKLNILEHDLTSCREIKWIKYISDRINKIEEINESTRKDIISLVDKIVISLDEVYNKVSNDLVFLKKKFTQITNQILQYQYIDNNIKRHDKGKITVMVKDILKVFENSFDKRDIKLKINYIVDQSLKLEYLKFYNLIFNLFDFLKIFFDIPDIDSLKELTLDIRENLKVGEIEFSVTYEFENSYYDIVKKRVNDANELDYFINFKKFTEKLYGTFHISQDFNNLRIIMKIPYKTR